MVGEGNLDVARATVGILIDQNLVPTQSTDSPSASGISKWQNPNWTKYHGYYRKVPDFHAATNMRALWVVGGGYDTDTKTRITLEHMSGCGVDTFDTIMDNMAKMNDAMGDSFAEIIRDPDTEQLVNLKPISGEHMVTVFNDKGIIIYYEQNSMVKNRPPKRFETDEILHFMNGRIAGEMHGISNAESVEEIIKANFEGFADLKELQHSYVRPRWIVHMRTDNQNKIDTFVTKFDATSARAKNFYVPMDTIKPELMAIPSNATLNSLPYMNFLTVKFYQAAGIPLIIMGGASEFSESSSKIAYLSHEVSVKAKQRYYEMQLYQQIQIKLKFKINASLQQELLSDTAKDGPDQQMGFQANDVTAGVGR